MMKRCAASLLSALMLLALSLVLPAFAAEKEFYSYTFENESDWSDNFAFGGETANAEWTNTPGVGHDDDAAIKITVANDKTYENKESVLRVTFEEPLPAGGAYRVAAWFYVPSAENPGRDFIAAPRLVLEGDNTEGDGSREVKLNKDFTELPLDEWKLLEVTLVAEENYINMLDFRFKIEGEPNHPDVWYFDNMSVYQIDGSDGTAIVPNEIVPYDGPPILLRYKTGTYGDFDFELWRQRPVDKASMTLTGNGTFQSSWDGMNALTRAGKRLGSVSTYKDYGEVKVEYAAEHNIVKGEVSYLCVYGWTEEPTIEFYIVENYGNYKPPGGKGYQGTIEVDGGTYEVYVDTRVNQPSIHGTETFQQYFSVRTDKRTEGTITISEHFKAWEEMGLDMSGVMYEIALCAEGYNSVGNANITKHILTVGDTVYGDVEEPSPEPSPEPLAPESAEPATPDTAPSAEPTADAADTDESGFPWLAAIVASVVAVAVLAVIIVVVVKRKPGSL